ncbi:BlaI/MecI/CopY family transcriptional regulator [Mycolicibacterium aromaticivorans]|nr:BlaI/MecI/CopY family transcriptional regulator [Mycolicibacterium aromaticivorans]
MARKPAERESGRVRRAARRPLLGLGELEALAMDVVWRTGEPVRVRDVIDGLEPGRDPAYTTVMTVMDNLYRKGWLTRERCGRAYFYAAARSRTEAATDAVRDLLAGADDPAEVLLHFARDATDAESKALSRGLRQRRRAQ